MAISKYVPVLSGVVVFTLLANAAFAAGPKGFHADWRRAEAAVTEALSAARIGDIATVHSESVAANDALLDLAAYAPALPDTQRAAYTKALEDVRIAAQRAIQPESAKTKEDSVTVAQNTLLKITSARASIPADWLRADVCTAMRKQRHHC